jgi:hypothetical protein
MSKPKPETMERRVRKNLCPFCGSNKTEPWCDERIQVDPYTQMHDGTSCIDMKCEKCEKTYSIHYKLDFTYEYNVETDYQEAMSNEVSEANNDDVLFVTTEEEVDENNE